MNVADYVIDRIAKANCDTIFGVYGAANGGLVDAFHRIDGTKFIAMQSEQGAGFAAEGYAKVRRVKYAAAFGCAMATSGPGGHNLVTPIANCFYDSVPCLFLTGQVNSAFMGDGSTRQVGFQETPICDIVKPIVKAAFLVKRPDDIGWVMDAALDCMTEGRPGPVLIDIPQDIQRATVNAERLDRHARSIETLGRDVLEWAERYIAELHRRRKPAFLVGGGCHGGPAKEFSAALGIPTFPTWNALDIITSDHPTYCGRIGTYGGVGFNKAIQASDIVLSIGSRISGRITGANPENFAPNAVIFAADIDQGTCDLLRATFKRRCHVVKTSASKAMTALRFAMTRSKPPSISAWVQQCLEWKKLDPVLDKYFHNEELHPYAFCRTLSDKMPQDAVIISDCGGNLAIMNHSFLTKTGQIYFSSNGNSPMGFSVAAAIGAYYADPGRQVFAVIGDGGFQINVQELQTISHNHLPLRIILINNKRYGITSQYQRTNFADRQIANGTCGTPGDYSVPDFGSVAYSYDITYTRNDKTSHMASHIETLLASNKPIIHEVRCFGFDTYLPRIAGAKPIDQMEIP